MATLSVLDSPGSLAPVGDPAVGDPAVADVRSLTKRLALAIETKSVASSDTPSSDKRSLPAVPDDQDAPAADRKALVNAAVNGDPQAVEEMLRWIRPLVVRYCRSRVGGQEKTFASADDVAQEVCLAVLTALSKYRDEGRPFLAFVYGIASHKVADAHRSAARNRAEPVSELPDSTDQADGPEEHVMHGEIAGRMTRLLESLSDRQRDIVHLRIVVGLSVEETAEAVGSTPGAVRVAQHRALNRLRTVLTSKPAAVPTHPKTVTGRIADQLGSFTEWTADGRAVW